MGTGPNRTAEDFVDGGNRYVIPSRVATDLAPEEVFVLSNNPPLLFRGDPDYSRSNLIKVTLRAISIFIQDVRENDIAVLDDYSKRTGAKVLRIEPETDLDPDHPTGLNFSVPSMMIWMAKGEQAARTVLGFPIV